MKVRKRIAQNNTAFQITFELIFAVLIVTMLKFLFDKFIYFNQFNLYLRYILFIPLTLVTVYFTLKRRLKIFTIIHENLHLSKAKKFNVNVKEIFYYEHEEKKLFHGFCQFEDGEYSKDSVMKVYLAPFEFYIVLFIPLLILSILVSNTLLSMILLYIAILVALQLPGCINDIKGYFDLRRTNKNINKVYFEKDHFYIKEHY